MCSRCGSAKVSWCGQGGGAYVETPYCVFQSSRIPMRPGETLGRMVFKEVSKSSIVIGRT